MCLVVDLEDSAVTVMRAGSLIWRPRTTQWVEFYVALALARMENGQEGWLLSGALCKLGAWRGKKYSSVGKIVARHLAQMRHHYERWIVESPRVTREWRLTLDRRAITVLPSEAQGADWLLARGVEIGSQMLSPAWLTHMTTSLMLLHLGQSAEAKDQAVRALHIPGIDDRSVRLAAFAMAKAAALRGELALDREHIDALLGRRAGRGGASERDLWEDDAAGRHMRMRLATLEAIESDFTDASAQSDRLKRRVESLSHCGDLDGLAILHNALGLLATRQGNFAGADYHLTEAIRLALTVSDLFTLGGALFNLAHLFELQSDLEGGMEKSNAAVALLRLCVEMDRRIGVGRNSAQAEILAGRLLALQGRLQPAEELLNRTKKLVAQSGNAYDAGCLLVARATLACARLVRARRTAACDRGFVEALLAQAAEKFALAGKNADTDAGALFERVRASLRRSRDSHPASRSPGHRESSLRGIARTGH